MAILASILVLEVHWGLVQFRFKAISVSRCLIH